MLQFKKLSLCLFAFFVFSSGAMATYASFPDVFSNHQNYDAINYVQDQDIVSGYPDGSFKPDSTINRAEFTKIVVEANFDASEIDSCIGDNVTTGSNTVFFSDVPEGEWYAKYICVAKINNIIDGYPDGTFKPANQINFVEAAKIIVIALGSDIAAGDPWYKPYVLVLDGDKAIPTSIASFSESISRGQMAEMIYRLKANITNKDSWTYAELEGGATAEENTDVNSNINLFIGLDSGNEYTPSFPIYRFDCFTSGCEPVQMYTNEWKLNTMNRLAFDPARNQIIYPAAAGAFQLSSLNTLTSVDSPLGLESKYAITYEPSVYGDTMAFTSFDSQTETIAKYNLVSKTSSDIDTFKGHLGCNSPAVSSTGKIYGICKDGLTWSILDEDGTSYYSTTKTDILDSGISSLVLDLNGNGYFIESGNIKKIVLSTKDESLVNFGSGYEVSVITITPNAEYLAAKAFKNDKWDIAVRNMSSGVVTVLKTVAEEPGMPAFGPYLTAEGDTTTTTTTTTTNATCSTSDDPRDAIAEFLVADTDSEKLVCMTEWAKQYSEYLAPELNLVDVQPNGNDDEIRGIDSHSCEVDVYYWYGLSETPVTKIFVMDKSSGYWLINAIISP